MPDRRTAGGDTPSDIDRSLEGLIPFFEKNYWYDREREEVLLRYTRLLSEFKRRYSRNSIFLARAPGRVNLIGEHTDYNGCPVLPFAIDRDIVAAFSPRKDNRIILQSLNSSFPERSFHIEEVIQPFPTGDWGNYAKAAVQGMIEYIGRQKKPVTALKGMEVILHGTIPIAAGLSSSSAMVVLVAVMLNHVNRIEIERLELAQLLAEAERYVGTQGGGMDQAASLLSISGHLLKIDFSPFKVNSVPIPKAYALVVAHSLVDASKTAGAMADQMYRRL